MIKASLLLSFCNYSVKRTVFCTRCSHLLWLLLSRLTLCMCYAYDMSFSFSKLNQYAFWCILCNKQRWSPRGRPWPRGHILKSLALALASKVKSLALKPQVLENWPVLGSRTALFFEQLKFNWKTPENSRKFCEYLFCFPLLEHRRTQGGQGSHSPPIEISPMTKMCPKAYCFFSFSFFLPFFADNSY